MMKKICIVGEKSETKTMEKVDCVECGGKLELGKNYFPISEDTTFTVKEISCLDCGLVQNGEALDTFLDAFPIKSRMYFDKMYCREYGRKPDSFYLTKKKGKEVHTRMRWYQRRKYVIWVLNILEEEPREYIELHEAINISSWSLYKILNGLLKAKRVKKLSLPHINNVICRRTIWCLYDDKERGIEKLEYIHKLSMEENGKRTKMKKILEKTFKNRMRNIEVRTPSNCAKCLKYRSGECLSEGIMDCKGFEINRGAARFIKLNEYKDFNEVKR